MEIEMLDCTLEKSLWRSFDTNLSSSSFEVGLLKSAQSPSKRDGSAELGVGASSCVL